MIHNTMKTALMTLILGLAITMTQTRAAATPDRGGVEMTTDATASERLIGRRLAGTWEIQGQPEPTCGVQPFTNLATIGWDGRIVNVDPDVGTAVGEAYRVGFGRYVAGFFGFIDAGGTTLIYEVQSTIRLRDASHFSGRFRAVVSDLAGNVQCSYNGEIDGHRLVAQPFPGN